MAEPNAQHHALPREFQYPLKTDPYSSHGVILSGLGPGRGRRLLDVGTAQGDLARGLKAQGFVVSGIERDPQLAAHARTHCEAVHELDLDADAIPAFQERFDVIVCADVLEHLRDPLTVLHRLTQCLTPGGIVVISVPNIAHMAIRLMLLFGYFEYMDRGTLDRTHLRFFTLRSFKHFLQEGGVRVDRLLATPFPFSALVRPQWQGGAFRAVNAVNAFSARLWKPGLAYQFVAFGSVKE